MGAGAGMCRVELENLPASERGGDGLGERKRKKEKGENIEQNPTWDGLETTSSEADTIFPGQLLLAAGA